jgi:hypothetical protein
MTDSLIRRAELALRTGQPRLAETYMRRALSESPEGRRWLRRHDFRLEIERLAARSGMTVAAFIPGRAL